MDGISSIDWAKKLVYFASNEGNVLEQQLWQVSFDGERKPITTAPGFHDGNFADSGGAYVDTFSTRMTPPATQPVPGRRRVQNLLVDARP